MAIFYNIKKKKGKRKEKVDVLETGLEKSEANRGRGT